MKKMYKKLIVAAATLIGYSSIAQVSAYAFVQTSGTYNAISGGTVVALPTGNTSGTSADDVIINLPAGSFPFSFVYNSIAYTGCRISTNGFITFGTTAPGTTQYTPISATTGYAGAVSGWARDLNGPFSVGTSSVTGNIRVEVVGVSPNREIVIQYENWRPEYSVSTTEAPVINFQIRLAETTNVISIVYGPNLYLIGSASLAQAVQIGLRGATNADYNNRTNAAAVSFTSSTAGTGNANTQSYNTTIDPPGMPSNGLIYRWTPPSGCTGMPSAGTVPASFSICPNTSAVITNTSTNLASGITYTWMQAPAAAGPWTNVSTGSGFNTQSLTTSTLNTLTFYQLVITCTNSSQSASTAIVSVNPNNPVTMCYCNQSLGGSGCSPTDIITNVSILGTPLNNNSTCNSTPANGTYSQFMPGPSTTATLNAGQSYTISVTTSANNIEAVWIDYNQNGVFEATEHTQITITSVANTATTAVINIPSNALAGQTGMRVRSRGASNPNGPTDACTNFGTGETEDYYVTIAAAPVCPGAPAANTAISSQTAVVCPGANANITLANTYTASGISYQWQASTTGSLGVYTSVSGATNTSYAPTNITTTTWYQAIITCVTGPASTTSTPVAVNIAATTTSVVPYFEGFEGITVNNQMPNCSWLITNTTICQTYTATPPPTVYNRIPHSGSAFASFRWGTNTLGDYYYTNGIQLNAGTTYSASSFYIADGAGGWSEFSMLYGMSQSTTGLVNIATANTVTNTTYSQLANTFTVPTSGIYYIALKAIGNSTPWYLTWDDLSITVVPSCTAAVGGTLSSASINSCNGSTVALNSTGATVGTGITYQWQVSNTPNGPYTNVTGGSGATTTSYTTAALPTGNYYYILQTTCTTATLTGVSNEGTVAINPIPTASASANGPICSGQTINLTGSSNIGTSFMWTGPNTYTANTQNPSITNAPAAANGEYTLIVSTPNCTSTPATVTVGVNATPSAITVTPGSTAFCAGGSATLGATGGNVPATLSFGTQANQNTATTLAGGYPGPYSAYYGGQKMQILVLASELTAAGFVANSPLTSIQFPVVSKGSNWGTSITENQGFQVNIGLTNITDITSFQTGLTNVVAPMNYTPTVGYNNIHTFSTPFIWNGTSNVIVETTWSNAFFGGVNDLVVSYNSPTTFTGTVVYRVDSQSPAAVAAATATNYIYMSRPDFKFNGASPGTFAWTPSASLSSATGSTVTATPASNTIYTVSVANGSCTANANVSVSVTPIPSVSVAVTSTVVCAGSPATLTASGATTYSWNTAATTTAISVSPTANTSYTVTGFNGTCTNTAVQSISVNPSPTVGATSSATLICNGSPAVLTATGATTYNWNTSATTTTISVTPSVTTSYTVTGTTNGCSNSFVISQAVSPCTGLSANAATASGILVYPNPNTGEFTIELNNGSVKNIQVMDLTGRIIIADTTSNDKVDFNINTLANGVYYVRIQSNNTVEVIKIVKQ